ncbi:MAG: RIP metalloprotease RseP [Caldiserica bacterium]|nr:RIP metalloprotease RseP [Caldisericota bacterium]MDH7562882.1 RIP metalloprotease RseP [Caldisericota bacterium]
MNVLIGILVLTVLAIGHELGHFIFAKISRVPVEEFAFGFGPAILSKKSRGTLYRLNLIPILAYVKVKGMEPGDQSPDGFNAQRIGKRFLILFGGPLSNMVLALLLFILLFSLAPMPTTTIGQIIENSPAEASGLLPGDQILAIGGKSVNSWEDITLTINQSQGGSPLAFEIQREGKTLEITATPTFLTEEKRFIVGIIPALRKRGFLEAIGSAFYYFGNMFLLIFQSLGMLFSGKVSLSDFSGPVGIVQITAQQAQAGIMNLLGITGVLSMALGVFNLIPFPALDGGHILFLVIEGIRKKKINPKVYATVNAIGFIFLLAFLLLVTWGDILRL